MSLAACEGRDGLLLNGAARTYTRTDTHTHAHAHAHTHTHTHTVDGWPQRSNACSVRRRPLHRPNARGGASDARRPRPPVLDFDQRRAAPRGGAPSACCWSTASQPPHARLVGRAEPIQRRCACGQRVVAQQPVGKMRVCAHDCCAWLSRPTCLYDTRVLRVLRAGDPADERGKA